MTDSIDLITAQISILEPQLALIHIPIEYYSFFLQPILRLLFGEDHDEDAAKIPWTNRHYFLNVSITPIECSVICSRDLAERFFRPLAEVFNQISLSGTSNGRTLKKAKDKIEISHEDYIVVQVEGQGLDAGQRVLELTSPLALAGISIFFITTYFSDYILVPSRSRRTVSKALEQRGFVFSHTADAFVSQLSPSSPSFPSRNKSYIDIDSPPLPPRTPPAKDISELQTRTFSRLKLNNIHPTVDPTLRLLNCAGSKELDPARERELKDNLLQVLLGTCPTGAAVSASNSPSKATVGLGFTPPSSFHSQPNDSPSPPNFSTRFLSLTLTTTEPISVLLESSTPLSILGSSLLGAKSEEDVLVPIVLDLRDLPMEATGIVCGVAGRLAQGTTQCKRGQNGLIGVEAEEVSPKSSSENPHERDEALASSMQAIGRGEGEDGEQSEERKEDEDEEQGAIEISFLSTARAGTVIVKASELHRAVKALREMTTVLEVEEG